MRLRLDYGSEGLEVDLPDERVTVIEPSFVPAIDNPHAALVAALRAPIGRPSLRDIVRPGQKIAISVCDITRAQPREAMLRALFEEMPGIKPDDVTILIATGTHRTNNRTELERILGHDIVANYTVVNHESRDDSSLAYLGDTNTGAPIYLNKKWLAADVRITTGFVEPHFFAGFSGGAKMVAPGLAGLKTVLVLHDAKRIGSPNATWGVIDGNPVQDDIREIARTTGVTFSIDVTLNRDQEITAVFAGQLFAEHRQARAFSKKSVMCPVDSPFDVVLTTNSGYPLDQNLYQAVNPTTRSAKRRTKSMPSGVNTRTRRELRSTTRSMVSSCSCNNALGSKLRLVSTICAPRARWRSSSSTSSLRRLLASLSGRLVVPVYHAGLLVRARIIAGLDD